MDKKIDLNELPEYLGENDAELFTDVADGFGEDNVSDGQLDRILSSTMRKAGYEMNSSIYEQGIIKITKASADNEPADDSAVKPVIPEEAEETEPHTETSSVKQWGGLAACMAFIAVAAVSMVMLFGGGFIKKSEPEDIPAVSVSEDSPAESASESESAPAESSSEPEAAVKVTNGEFPDISLPDGSIGDRSFIVIRNGENILTVDPKTTVNKEEMRKLGMVEMPNVFYMSSEAAEASIKKKGLVPRKVEAASLPLIEEDKVFYTEPSSGQYVKVGSEVTYYVCDMRASRLEEVRMLSDTFSKKYKDVLSKFKADTGVIFERPSYTEDMTYESLTAVSDRFKYLISLDDRFEEYLYNDYYNSLVTVEIPVPESVIGTDARIYLYKYKQPYLSIDISKDSKTRTVSFDLRGENMEMLEVYISDRGNFDVASHEPYLYVDLNFITKTYTLIDPHDYD